MRTPGRAFSPKQYKAGLPQFTTSGIAIIALLTASTQAQENVDPIALASGEALARQHCSSCHVFTEPELLTRESWKFLLTYMGFRMGIDDVPYLGELSPIEKQVLDTRRESLAQEGLIPEHPAMSDANWKELRLYFESKAPVNPLPQVNKVKSAGHTKKFVVKKPSRFRIEGVIASMAKIDPFAQQVILGDSLKERLILLDKDLEPVDSIRTGKAFWVDALLEPSQVLLLSVGDIAGSQIQGRLGKLAYGQRKGAKLYPEGFLLSDLYRPTDIEQADLDGDGYDELLVCNFGDEGGSFEIYQWNAVEKSYNTSPAQTLYNGTGPLRCGIADFNEDGRLDIVLLVSDVEEQILLYINQGELGFDRQTILQKPPTWGFMDLQIADVDQDGQLDILASNGDNIDSDPYNTLKPYHGVRIYRNEGQLRFSESYHYPLYGAYQIQARDFDLDGDIDIAANAFYPDFNADTPESFVFLEQKKPMEFTPYHLPETESGRWISMDAGDIDGDGDDDLILGAAYVPIGMEERHLNTFKSLYETGPTVLLLENQARP